MNVQPDYVSFSDRDLGKQFPAILKAGGVQVRRHSDYFADDAKDEEWLRAVGQHGWYVLTHNRRIRYTPNEISAVKRFGIGLLVIIGKAPFAQLAQNFVMTLPKIYNFLDKNPRPFIAKVYRSTKTKKASANPTGRISI